MQQVLTQVAFTLRDAAALPWVAVHSAYVVSMSEIEEGRLKWADCTKWALNRIGAVISNKYNEELYKYCVINSGTTNVNQERMLWYKIWYSFGTEFPVVIKCNDLLVNGTVNMNSEHEVFLL